MKPEKIFKRIFPNGDFKEFLRKATYLKLNLKTIKGVEFALYCYGEIRSKEFNKEKRALLKAFKG